MKSVVLLLVVFAVEASAQCTCVNLLWAKCEGTPCKCYLPVQTPNRQLLDCTKLIPKCFLMKAEMAHIQGKRRLGGKPVETAIVDNDGIYDPDCTSTGQFRPKQCNNTEECWCVNSAGVRRSDKGSKDIQCEEVETYWIRLDLKHTTASHLNLTKIKTTIENVLQERYKLGKNLVKEVKYDEQANLMVVDIKKDIGDRTQDLSHMAYYLMKDVKGTTLFSNGSKLKFTTDGQNVSFEDIIIYYVDEKPPTFTMKSLTGGVIAVIVVVLLAVVCGLLVVYFVRKRERAMNKGQ
ncbi:epithelial cell adhesion molecule-like [Arapaima gigas]